MSATKLSTFELIDRINLLVNSARTIPLSGKMMLDRDEMSDLLRRLEESIPQDLQQAKQLLAVEQQIIDESRRQAETTVREANQNAKTTVENATNQANSMLQDAKNRAGETLRGATDQANALMADAQARANALVADAQTRAQQMVADSEIVARAQAEAQEMLEAAHREGEDYSLRVHGAVSQMMEHADASLSQQLDALRALRQEIAARQ